MDEEQKVNKVNEDLPQVTTNLPHFNPNSLSNYVREANRLVRSKQDELTLLEMKLIRLAIAQVLKGDTKFLTYKTDILTLSQLLGIEKHNIYHEVNRKKKTRGKKSEVSNSKEDEQKETYDFCKELMKKTITIETGKSPNGKINYDIIHWVDYVSYRDGEITFKLSEQLRPYLTGLNGIFTTFPYSDLLALPSTSAIRLYEILVSYVNIQFTDTPPIKMYGIQLKKNEVLFTVDDLKKMFDVEEKYRRNTGDFIDKVIDKARLSINEKTMLNVEMRKIKVGKSIQYIIFEFVDMTPEKLHGILKELGYAQ